jgi:L-fucose isomerase and related proteins
MKNTVNLVIFSSMLHDNESVMNSRKALFEGIRSFANLEITYPSALAAGSPVLESLMDGGNRAGRSLPNGNHCKTVCFIATGGTEEIFRNYVESLPRPVLLLSDGLHNSFAASFEIRTYLTQRGIRSLLMNAPLECGPEFFAYMEEALFGEQESPDLSTPSDPLPKFPKAVLKAFDRMRIGLIGGASGWLISSDIDRAAVEQTYGVKFVVIPLSELEEDFTAVSEEDPALDEIVGKMQGFLSGGRTPEDLRKAARMYIALKKLIADNELNALTLKCFGILNSCRTTACLALSLLNDEGIIAGCEGDIPALWTMMYVNYAFGQSAFMANPASSNRKELTIDFAHCTIPLAMVHGYRLPSHFESNSGIGIAGSVPSGRYRIIKIYGEHLDQYYETSGDLLMNTNIPQRCRTQIRFRFSSEEEFNRFIRVSKGNHIILCRDAGQAGPSR